MKIFIAGGNGQVGFELQRSLSLWGEILAPRRETLNLACQEDVIHWLEEKKPDYIVNAAAYTNVEKAEVNKSDAWKINYCLPKLLSSYAVKYKVPLVHYSTDYVYDGMCSRPYREDDVTLPLNVYGASKAAGDNAIISSGAYYIIFRTSWVYSIRNNNFFLNMLRVGRKYKEINVVNDQIGAPTTARLLAQVTACSFMNPIHAGIYHVTARGVTSWYGFACQIFSRAAAMGIPHLLDSSKIHKISSSQYPSRVQRPTNSRLSIEKIESSLHIKLPNWKYLLDITLQEYAENISKKTP